LRDMECASYLSAHDTHTLSLSLSLSLSLTHTHTHRERERERGETNREWAEREEVRERERERERGTEGVKVHKGWAELSRKFGVLSFCTFLLNWALIQMLGCAAGGPDADLSVFEGHELHVVPTAATLTFEHTYTWWGECPGLRLVFSTWPSVIIPPSTNSSQCGTP
jgi:hypothetical protein